jgi:biotin carboxyl carrier protein
MKMEIPVEAEQGGIVAAIHCSVGQAVDEGDVLIDLT